MSEIAWAAGLFDGEGHVAVETKKRKQGYRYGCLIVTVSQRHDPEVLERFRAAVGIGTVSKPSRRGDYRYDARGRAALDVLAKITPWLSGPKRGTGGRRAREDPRVRGRARTGARAARVA